MNAENSFYSVKGREKSSRKSNFSFFYSSVGLEEHLPKSHALFSFFIPLSLLPLAERSGKRRLKPFAPLDAKSVDDRNSATSLLQPRKLQRKHEESASGEWHFVRSNF
ncbi:hypothetical protein TNIN_406531 [Trichonephila inaurata madagascariensis]|uniref:Uncharacterized protein n=1 Tax=Trichonephila inaurata madagascariensis TaxID=2747483 RepID=A0A8X6XUM3_9ARAC|nr:hypothetical protein TNIN_406531 [Trichonephila inaurata madagascariensis]